MSLSGCEPHTHLSSKACFLALLSLIFAFSWSLLSSSLLGMDAAVIASPGAFSFLVDIFSLPVVMLPFPRSFSLSLSPFSVPGFGFIFFSEPSSSLTFPSLSLLK